MEYKFKIGDEVKIVYSGSGCGRDACGKITRIIKLGKYGDTPGYQIDPPFQTNSETGSCDYMCGEKSFELAEGNIPMEDLR